MLPEWLHKILADLGLPGAIIFVLLLTVIGLVAYIKSMQAKADKVYGYRLTERDTLNTALTNTAKVLADMLEATEDRNDLTQEQAELIQKQAMAFELLKATILAQYDNIKEYNSAASQAVQAMAAAIRTLTEIVRENKHALSSQIERVGNEIKEAVRAASKTQVDDVRGLLGAELTVVRRIGKPRKPQQ